MAGSGVRPFMVAVTGGSGSGKSTLVQGLATLLGERACVLEDDHYYLPRAEHGNGAEGWMPRECEVQIDFDSTSSKDKALFLEHLTALKRGERVDRPVYDFARHDRVAGVGIGIEPSEVVLVEGIHVLGFEAARALFDFTIFVDAPADVRLARRIYRDVRERGRSVGRCLQQYFTYVRPAHERLIAPLRDQCDLLVESNDGPTSSGNSQCLQSITLSVELALSEIEARLIAHRGNV